MANPVLTAPHFHNEEAAFAFVEAHLGRKARFARIAGIATKSALAA